MDFDILSDRENERNQKDRQILGSSQRVEKTVEHEGNDDTNCSWCPLYGSQGIEKETEGSGDQRKN